MNTFRLRWKKFSWFFKGARNHIISFWLICLAKICQKTAYLVFHTTAISVSALWNIWDLGTMVFLMLQFPFSMATNSCRHAYGEGAKSILTSNQTKVFLQRQKEIRCVLAKLPKITPIETDSFFCQIFWGSLFFHSMVGYQSVSWGVAFLRSMGSSTPHVPTYDNTIKQSLINLHIISPSDVEKNELVRNLHILLMQPEDGNSSLKDDIIMENV